MEHPSRQRIVEQTTKWAQWWLAQNPLLASKIVQHCERESGDSVKQAITESVRFLYLCSISQSPLTPSLRVDATWHQLILFTRSYGKFCQDNLGRFIHHQPSHQPDCELVQYLATLDLYRQIFGRPDPMYWPYTDSSLNGTEHGECGPCES